jgi:acyl-CoA synthetase (NDP forming)
LSYLEKFEQQSIEQTARLMEKYDKPIVGVYLLNDDKTRTVTEVEGCKYKGVNFITPERSVKALGKMYKYAQWLKG